MKNRALEVALWVAHAIIMLAILICISLFTSIAVVEGVDADVIGAAVIVAVVILLLYAVLWVGIYIASGHKFGPAQACKLIFGTMPPYLWFAPSVLCLGGLAYAISHSPTYHSVFWSSFSEGVGAAFAIFALGAVGRFYKPNRFLGHVVGTTVAGILAIMTIA